jgi:hypothetical protein
MSFVFISHVKKKDIGTGCGFGVGWGLFSDLPYIVVNSVLYKLLWVILCLYEVDLCCVYLRVAV